MISNLMPECLLGGTRDYEMRLDRIDPGKPLENAEADRRSGGPGDSDHDTLLHLDFSCTGDPSPSSSQSASTR
ncbi:MAG: hypothetical protein Q7T08_09200, partial [Devosia sp.]|nr:hypothetical protein [Devosia sp.]